MVLDTVIYGSITLGNALLIAAGVLGAGGLYLFLQKDEWVMKFNQLLDSGVSKAGAAKDKGYSEDEMRDKLMNAMENDSKDRGQMEKEMTMEHIMSEIEAIQSQAKELGRQEERMKGEDSDAVYNLVFINLAISGLLTLMYIWVNFI